MKPILALLLIIIPLSVFPQANENITKDFKQSVYFTKNNGDSIRVIGEIEDASSDSAAIIVESIRFGKTKLLQRFKLEFYYPLDLNFASYDNKKGITYTYDPRISYGNSYLFLFNEELDRLQEVKGYNCLSASFMYVSHKTQYFSQILHFCHIYVCC